MGTVYRHKLGNAEKMYQRALEGYENALGLEKVVFYILALNIVYDIGLPF